MPFQLPCPNCLEEQRESNLMEVKALEYEYLRGDDNTPHLLSCVHRCLVCGATYEINIPVTARRL